MSEKSYIVSYECGNCYRWLNVHIPYRVEKPSCLECPNCGIDELTPTKSMPKNFDYCLGDKSLTDVDF